MKRSRVIALSCLLGAIVLFSEMGSAFKLADLFAFHSDNPELTCTITSNGPPTITSNTVTYNSVTVQWPAASESGDGCSGIVYQVTGGPVAYQTTGIAQTVGDLASLTSYTFNVTATDGAATASLGSVSATSVCLITPPTDFIVNNISSSGGNFSANLQWTEPPASTNPYACPSGSGYMTQYQVSGFGTNDPALTTDTQTTVSGLNVGTYQARVVTQVNTGVTGVGIVNSIPTYLILNTSCTVNSSKNLTFSSEKNNATLSWSVPATPYVGNACPNGKVQYQVQGGIPGAPYSTQQTSKKITELQPFSSYQARVTATLGSYQSFPTMITIQTEAKKNYLMLQIASNVIPPVYIYQQVSKKIQQQIGFMSSASAQVFLGEYDPNNTNATYHFYYQDKSNQWHQCQTIIKSGKIQPNQTNCNIGLVINPPSTLGNYSSNVYTLAFGGQSWESLSGPPSPTPINPYQPLKKRTITFLNTSSHTITLGETCAPAWSPGAGELGCEHIEELVMLNPTQSKSYDISNEHGLVSTRFYVTKIDNKSIDSQQAYSTLFEATWPAKGSGDNAFTPTNLDISAVDGFSKMGMRVYPTTGYAYCTGTAGVENSNLLSADQYSQSNPITSLVPLQGTSLQEICKQNGETISIIQNGVSTPLSLALSHQSSSGEFRGCYSPCTYVTIQHNTKTPGFTSEVVDRYCCSGKYATPDTCNAQYPGASNSAYVSNMEMNFPKIYTYAYDDYRGDYACDGLTNLTVELTDGGVPPACTLAAPTVNITNIHTQEPTIAATVNWSLVTPVGTGCPSSSSTYQLTVTPQSSNTPIFSQNNLTNTSQTLTDKNGLIAGTAYNVSVVAQDGAFTSQPGTNTFTTIKISTPIIQTISSSFDPSANTSDGNITWNVSTETPPGDASLVYNVMIMAGSSLFKEYDGIKADSKNTVSLKVQGLSPGQSYTAKVIAEDDNKNTSEVSTKDFTAASATPTCTLTAGTITATPAVNSGNITWTDATASACSGGSIAYTANITPANGSNPSSNSQPWSPTGLTAGTQYTVNVTATYVSDGTTLATANYPVATFVPQAPATCTVNPPAGLSISSLGAYHAVIAWNAATESGDACGHNITYQITTSPNATVSSAPGSLQATIDTLSPNNTYTVTVTAQDGSYQSQPSSPLEIETNCTVNTPGTPTVTGTSQDSVTVQWTPADPLQSGPACDNKSNIVYTVNVLSPSGGVVATQTTNQDNAVVGSLLPGTYTATVTASNNNDAFSSNPTPPTLSFSIPASPLPPLPQLTLTGSWASRVKISATCIPPSACPNAACAFTFNPGPAREEINDNSALIYVQNVEDSITITATVENCAGTPLSASITCANQSCSPGSN